MNIISFNSNNTLVTKVDRPGGHAEPEESLKLLPIAERKVPQSP